MFTLIFVHGACVRDAAWWWNSMTKPLADRGIASIAVALPSCGETGDELGDLYADVDACRRAIVDVDGTVVLCGHSDGGMIITEAGADARVTQLLYVTSVMPDVGQSQADLIGSEPAPWLRPSDDGTVGVDPEMIREFFLQDCDETTTEQALGRLTRQSLTPFTQPPRQIAWEQMSATYVVCTEDLATPADVQRQRVRANTRLVEFNAGHHPFLSRLTRSGKASPPRSTTIDRKPPTSPSSPTGLRGRGCSSGSSSTESGSAAGTNSPSGRLRLRASRRDRVPGKRASRSSLSVLVSRGSGFCSHRD